LNASGFNVFQRRRGGRNIMLIALANNTLYNQVRKRTTTR